jgi:tartrate dehydratase beta subunit/fumarate hydratase class I family protein
MDKFVEPLLSQTGQLAMIGKAERGPEAIQSIRRHGVASSWLSVEPPTGCRRRSRGQPWSLMNWETARAPG